MSEWLRWWLPGFLIIYLAAAFVWPTVRVWRATGLNPYRLGNSDSAHDFVGRGFRLALLAASVVAIVFAINPAWYAFLTPIAWLQHPALGGVGVALLLASAVWTLVAQTQMGRSWRIGIDAGRHTELVQQGVFAVSRNPIFLGMRLTLLGFFLTLPNAVTLCVLVLGEALIQIQVRLEEEHLLRAHGEAYRNYMRRVRRWL
jgi:protein-S-isoprenylcysteine O-methyltransferase Ste14